MLSEILDAKTCAECKFCCSFRRCSLWETPVFTIETAEKLKDKCDFNAKDINGCKGMLYDLSDKYVTEDREEEVPCPFLDADKGCTLDSISKPFDCKIWPFRVLDKEGELLIGLTPSCPAVNKIEEEKLREFVKSKISVAIFEYAQTHKEIIKAYNENYIIMCFQEVR